MSVTILRISETKPFLLLFFWLITDKLLELKYMQQITETEKSCENLIRLGRRLQEPLLTSRSESEYSTFINYGVQYGFINSTPCI